MTSPLQGELQARAAAHASAWRAANSPESGVAEVEREVRRGRRGRGLVGGAAAVAGVVVLASATYAALGRGPDAVAPGEDDVASALEQFEALGPDDVVLTVSERATVSGVGFTDLRILIVHGGSGDVSHVSSLALAASLGGALDEWPMESLVAIDPSLSRAVFLVQDPATDHGPQVAVHSFDSRETVVVDPCASPLNSIDVGQWCATGGDGPATVIDPVNGGTLPVEGYDECASAADPYGHVVAASCVRDGHDGYLVTVSPVDGTVLTAQPTGIGLDQAPWVVDGELFANSSGTDSGPFLIDGAGNVVLIGGGAAAGLGVVGDRLLVQTSSDMYGTESQYGHILGFWSPATGEFTPLPGTTFERGARITAVEVIE